MPIAALNIGSCVLVVINLEHERTSKQIIYVLKFGKISKFVMIESLTKINLQTILFARNVDLC